MRIRRGQADGNSDIIDISSLLDVMFILIIFFMATMTFNEEERDMSVKLPVDAEGQVLSSAESVIVINVRKSNTYVIMSEQVTVEEMAALIRKAVEEDPDKKVLVRADQEALHGYVAKAIGICRHQGVLEANIGYHIPN